MNLTTAQRDRVAGALLGAAAGDALGAGYEFGPPMPADTLITMRGGGGFGWSPGEWTDDTSMAIVIARVAAEGLDLRTAEAQDRIAAGWVEWAAGAKDVGGQTRAVLGAVRCSRTVDAVTMSGTAHLPRADRRSAGSGSRGLRRLLGHLRSRRAFCVRCRHAAGKDSPRHRREVPA